MFRADLHCHSTCSDGSLSPKELVALAVEQGLQGLAITDHDTVAAYPAVLEEAREKGVEMISGVEFSCEHREHNVHLLAYAFDIHHEELQSFCEAHKKRREQRYQGMLRKLREGGVDLQEEVVEAHSLGRPHLAKLLVDQGRVKDVKEAFQRYLGDGKLGYVPSSSFGVQETIDLIHRAGGLAVLAHPMLIRRNGVLRDLLEMNFDGIEGYYAKFPRNQEERWVLAGTRRGWMVTGGSDFHGAPKPHIPLGASWVGEELFAQLRERFRENNLK